MLNLQLSETGRIVKVGVEKFIDSHHSLADRHTKANVIPGEITNLWKKLAEDGWLTSQLDTQCDGAGVEAFAILVDLFGDRLVPDPIVACGVLPARLIALSAPSALRNQLSDKMASGDAKFAVAWQEASHEQAIDPQQNLAVLNGRANGTKRFVFGGSDVDFFLVTGRDQTGGFLVFAVSRDAPGVAMRSRHLIDGSLCVDVCLDNVLVEESVVLTRDPTVLRAAVDEARFALALYLTALARRAVRLTIDYTTTRRQFDRSVASFQVVQHRIVDLAIAVRLAEAVCEAALSAKIDGSPAFATLAASAKATAADVAMRSTRGAIQLHGAIGYAEETDIGLYLKAALSLSPWLGTATSLRAQAGALNGDAADA
jgi:alkylation response protein AidB-like acyl-CoA dehydrogenase